MIQTALPGLSIVGLALFSGFHLDRRPARSLNPPRRVRPADLRPSATAEPLRQATGS